jgi:hypothetical protein
MSLNQLNDSLLARWHLILNAGTKIGNQPGGPNTHFTTTLDEFFGPGPIRGEVRDGRSRKNRFCMRSVESPDRGVAPAPTFDLAPSYCLLILMTIGITSRFDPGRGRA